MPRKKTEKLQLLFVSRRWPPSTGGMERFAFDLYNSLVKDSDIHLLKWGGRSNLYLIFVIPVFFVKSVWILLTSKIDIIHMQDGVMSFMGAILKTIFRKPLVVVIHGLDVTYNSRIFQKVIMWSLKKADRIISISQAAADEAIKRGISKDKITVIPLGVTDELRDDKIRARNQLLKKFKLSKKASIIITVGRLVERKGVTWFCREVIPDILVSDKNIHYFIVGNGPEKINIENEIRSNNLSKNVHLLGRVSDVDLKAIYNGADVFVMPNIHVYGDMEGFGRVLIEAALCEMVVIASGIEGIKDAITDGENGILVGSKQSHQFIESITKILADKDKATSFANHARDFSIKKFNWVGIARQYRRQYDKVVNDYEKKR